MDVSNFSIQQIITLNDLFKMGFSIVLLLLTLLFFGNLHWNHCGWNPHRVRKATLRCWPFPLYTIALIWIINNNDWFVYWSFSIFFFGLVFLNDFYYKAKVKKTKLYQITWIEWNWLINNRSEINDLYQITCFCDYLFTNLSYLLGIVELA